MAGFIGNDSLTYSYCLGTECKEAKVSFQVFPPCQFSLNPDFYSFPDRSNDLLSLNVLSNDVLNQCTSSAITKAWSVQAKSISWSNNTIEILLQPFASGKVNISYEVCGSFNRCRTADVVVETNPQSEYCETNFKLKNDTLTLPNGFYFRIFQPADLLKNDGYCQGKINLSSFEITRFPATNGSGKLVFQNDSWWYLVNNPRNFVSDNFAYRICTQAGKCDTATVAISKNW